MQSSFKPPQRNFKDRKVVLSDPISPKPLHIPVSYGKPPRNWSWSRLDDLCEGIFDCPHSTPKLTETGPFVVRTQDIISGFFRSEQAGRVSEETFTERTSRVTPNRGDLFYSREGTYFGIAAEVPENARVCLGQRMVLIRPQKHNLDFRYLRYWLNSPVMGAHIQGFRDGSVAERLNLPTIRGLPVLVPPLPEQKAIAHILGTLDDKIDLNRRMNATLEAKAQALFKSWFVDFDPIHAKKGRRPFGFDETTAALFPATFRNSPLGPIPNGWHTSTLGELAKNISVTYDFSRSSDVIFINTSDVLEGDFLHANRSSHFGLPGQAKKTIERDDILFSEIRPANKRFAYVDFDSSDYVVSTKFMIIRASRDIHPRILYRILTRDETLNEFQVQAESRSGTFPQITFESISHLPIILPTMAIQLAYQEIVADIDSCIKVNKQQSCTLAALRDALLPKLLSGDLRVTS